MRNLRQRQGDSAEGLFFVMVGMELPPTPSPLAAATGRQLIGRGRKLIRTIKTTTGRVKQYDNLLQRLIGGKRNYKLRTQSFRIENYLQIPR